MRLARVLASVWFVVCRPTLWPVLAMVLVFRLLVWLGDPWADWWWRVVMRGPERRARLLRSVNSDR